MSRITLSEMSGRSRQIDLSRPISGESVALPAKTCSARSKTYRENKKTVGICVNCRNTTEPGLTRCSACLAKKRQAYVQAKELGLCCDCSRPVKAGRVRCPDCRGRYSPRPGMC